MHRAVPSRCPSRAYVRARREDCDKSLLVNLSKTLGRLPGVPTDAREMQLAVDDFSQQLECTVLVRHLATADMTEAQAEDGYVLSGDTPAAVPAPAPGLGVPHALERAATEVTLVDDDDDDEVTQTGACTPLTAAMRAHSPPRPQMLALQSLP